MQSHPLPKAQSFRKKDRTSIGENRIHLWSNGSHAAVFPVGAAPVQVPLLCFLTKSGTSIKCCCLRSTIIERHLGGVLVNNQMANSTGGFMARKLEGKKVAILVTDGFEQVEMTKTETSARRSRRETKIVSLKSGQNSGHASRRQGRQIRC